MTLNQRAFVLRCIAFPDARHIDASPSVMAACHTAGWVDCDHMGRIRERHWTATPEGIAAVEGETV